jgi:hypothetical protein
MSGINQGLSLFNEVLSPNFFGILTGANQARNFVLLWDLDDYFGDSINGVERSQIVQHVDDFLSANHMTEVGDEGDENSSFAQSEGQVSTSRVRASIFVKNLVDRGWLEEEQVGFTSYERRSDGFVSVFGALKGLVLGQNSQEEYSTALISIYQTVSFHSPKTFVQTIEDIKTNREILVANLKSIDSKIKRFIHKALNGPEKDDKELLDTLLIKYQTQPYYRALVHLNLEENPSKFQASILEGLERMETTHLDAIVTAFVTTKEDNLQGEEYINARNKYQSFVLDILRKTEQTISTLSAQVDSIFERHSRYVTSTREILSFRLNHGKNISGLIDAALRKIKAMDEMGTFDYSKVFPVPYFHEIDSDSLYKSRKIAARAPKQVEMAIRTVDPTLAEEAKRLGEYQNKFTREAVELFILTSLGERSEMKASDIKVDNIDDALRLLMAPIFGSQLDSKYSVSPKSGSRFDSFGFNMDDYVISRKENLL